MFGLFRKPATYTVRAIGPAAAGECARLHAVSFAHPWPAAEFESLLAAKNAIADGAYSGPSRLIGFALSRQAAGEAEVLSVAVARNERGKGVGGAIMRTHLARLAAAGIAAVFLEVDQGNASAIALYRRFGFDTVGERKSYYRGQVGAAAAPALTLRCDLG